MVHKEYERGNKQTSEKQGEEWHEATASCVRLTLGAYLGVRT